MNSNSTSSIPYDSSKITKILKESFGGNSFTTMILTVSPDVESKEALQLMKLGEKA